MARKKMDLRAEIADLREIVQVLSLRLEKLEYHHRDLGEEHDKM